MVSLKSEENNSSFGHLQIVSNSGALSGEDVLYRMQSIINIMKAIDLEQINKSDLFFLASILEDYLPSEAQANSMFNVLNKK